MGKLFTSCATLKMPTLRKNFQHKQRYIPMPLPDFANEINILGDFYDGIGYNQDMLLGIDEGCLWSDGETVYYSGGGLNYVFDKETLTWSKKNWINPPPDMYGRYIWSDGDNIYSLYWANSTSSGNENSYILNKETGEWTKKSWNGLDKTQKFMGSYIWTDGENIYESNEGYHYMLNKETDTWVEKKWNGLTKEEIGDDNFRPYNLWRTEKHIYHSYDDKHLILDKSTNTWNEKKWYKTDGTEMNFSGNDIWYDGKHYIYSDYSYGKAISYKLLDDEQTWEPYLINGSELLSPDNSHNSEYFLGRNFWSDGNNIYYAGWLNYGVLLPQEAKFYSYTNGKWGNITDCLSPTPEWDGSYTITGGDE